MKNKKILGLTAVSVALAFAVFSSSVVLASDCDDQDSCQYSSCGNGNRDCDHGGSDDCHDCDPGRSCVCNEAIWGNGPFALRYRQIAENGNYCEWRNVMWRYGFLSTFRAVNENNFSRFVQAMRLIDRGDLSGAQAILNRIDRNLYSYSRGFANGFRAGYAAGWRDARNYYTACDGGSGRCDAYGIRF